MAAPGSMINNGLVNYGVFTLAVDRKNPDTVYAATEGGLCKSTDCGAHWQLLPKTGPKDLHITGEKGKSIRCIAVDPADGKIIYAGSPAGKIYKSTDGGQTWTVSYEKKEPRGGPRRAAGAIRAGERRLLRRLLDAADVPKDAKAEQCSGLGFSFKSEGAQPRDVFPHAHDQQRQSSIAAGTSLIFSRPAHGGHRADQGGFHRRSRIPRRRIRNRPAVSRRRFGRR